MTDLELSGHLAECYQAYALKLGGLSYYAIGQRLKLSTSTAKRRCDEARETLPRESIEELRAMARDRLDVVRLVAKGLMESANPTDRHKGADLWLKIEKRDAELTGTDAPERANIEVRVKTEQEVDLDKLLTAADARVRAEEAALKERVPNDDPTWRLR
jgi:hypothetical protein